MLTDKQRWIAISGAAAAGAAFVTQALLKRGWNAVTGEDPPVNPASGRTAWTEAVVWTVAAGAAAGLSRLVARRAAAEFMDGPVPTDKFG